MNIRIDLKVFLFIIIFWLTKQIKIYTILMFFALIHESIHLVVGIIVGFKPESIKISPYGFSINFKTRCEDYNIKVRRANFLSIKKIIIYLAGPISNLIIALSMLLYYKVSGNENVGRIGTDLIIYSNILLFIFNLIPIYPLDGGRILKEAIYIYMGLEKSYYIVNKVAKISIIILTIASSIFVLIYKNIAIVLIIIYLWILVSLNSKHTKRIMQMRKIINMN